jgi:hypothetical protein
MGDDLCLKRSVHDVHQEPRHPTLFSYPASQAEDRQVGWWVDI